jgi:hypothetical protein
MTGEDVIRIEAEYEEKFGGYFPTFYPQTEEQMINLYKAADKAIQDGELFRFEVFLLIGSIICTYAGSMLNNTVLFMIGICPCSKNEL